MPRKVKKPVLGKRGQLNDDVKGYIDRHHDRMTAEQIAAGLGQPQRVVAVQVYINEKYGDNRKIKKELNLAQELETRPEWQHFRQEFTAEELDHFRNRYVQLMSQFRDDIMPTEEMQIFEVIRLDILIQRIMKEHKDVQENMLNANEGLRKIEGEFKESGDRALLDDCRQFEARVAKCSESLRNLAQRYESYLMRKSAMLKELKATRDQRVKIFENSKQSFLGWLRLIAEDDQRDAMGREAELMRLAADAEAARLALPHTYADGTVDQPLLTPETVLDE